MKVVHIAGLEVRIGRLMRQRCAWCGVLLWDADLDRDMSTGRGEPHGWKMNGLVEVDGNLSGALPHPEDGKLPLNACDRTIVPGAS
jgi:hypothetical protein